MTEKGWAVHETAFEVVDALQAEWAERIGPDNMAELRRLLQLVIAELKLDREHD